MKLFFDTETTGKALFKSPVTHTGQPHIVQLAAIMCADTGEERGYIYSIIKPDGWTIPDEAAAIHGITTELANNSGIPLLSALSVFSNFLHLSDLLIAHNIDFDAFVLSAELSRRTGNGIAKLSEKMEITDRFCTMRNTTQLCKLPGNFGDYKWPKLTESHKTLFGTDVEGSHDAMADVRACARIYFEITKQK